MMPSRAIAKFTRRASISVWMAVEIRANQARSGQFLWFGQVRAG